MRGLGHLLMVLGGGLGREHCWGGEAEMVGMVEREWGWGRRALVLRGRCGAAMMEYRSKLEWMNAVRKIVDTGHT